jgi:hypothetical protein
MRSRQTRAGRKWPLPSGARTKAGLDPTPREGGLPRDAVGHVRAAVGVSRRQACGGAVGQAGMLTPWRIGFRASRRIGARFWVPKEIGGRGGATGGVRAPAVGGRPAKEARRA